jgi:hypothetical protein
MSSNERPFSGSDHRGIKKKPAWLESVFWYSRNKESAARSGEMDTTEVTVLHLEAMGSIRLQEAKASWSG